MTNLSSAAQAVLDAVLQKSNLSPTVPVAAAALRAVADQIVPHSELMPQQDIESRREAMVWGMVNQSQITRLALFSIAAELENQ